MNHIDEARADYAKCRQHLHKLNDDLRRIHPEHATPVLLAELQRACIEANRKHIESLERFDEFLQQLADQERRIREIERNGRRNNP